LKPGKGALNQQVTCSFVADAQQVVMTDVTTLRRLLFCCKTGGQQRFVKFPEDERVAARWWWIKFFNVLTRAVILGKHTFEVNY